MDHFDDIIIGAGPAGCSALTSLAAAGRRVLVLEKLPQPGGLARTIARGGNRFDIGPHRFFTKSSEVLALWRKVVGEDLISVNRLTRIFYNDHLVNYPLLPMNALRGLGPMRSVAALGSYLARRVQRAVRPREPQSFEDWVTDQFGPVLFRAFFKDYTEKVWGIPCTQVSAEWASQRIKGLSLSKAVFNAFRRKPKSDVKTLVERFLYPRLGAGQFCENIAATAKTSQCEFRFDARVMEVQVKSGLACAVSHQDASGKPRNVSADNVITSIPLPELICCLSPAAPQEVLDAAKALRFRDHIAVNLVLGEPPFPDNWIYVHSPSVRLGRVVNYHSFSGTMCAREGAYPMTVEYFVFRGDETYRMSDDALCDLALDELRQMGLLSVHSPVQDRFVVRSHDVYPVLERGHREKVELLKGYVATLRNLRPIGRGGMFKYNNQDHSVMTGLLAARNTLGANFDVWSVNVDAEYHESGAAPKG